MGISLVLFDRFEGRIDLFPLASTRPIGNLRIGAFTLDEKWSKIFQTDVSYLTEDYLASKFPLATSYELSLVIKATILPNENLIAALKNLKNNQRLVDLNGDWIAFMTDSNSKDKIISDVVSSSFENILFTDHYVELKFPEDIFINNASQVEFDFTYQDFEEIPTVETSVTILGDKHKISKTAQLRNCTLNSKNGSIIIQENAVIEEGSVIHGPAVIGENVRVKSGTVIYPNVTIGKNSTICGELNNTVIWGNSAKGHYGYLGCAVIGEGCNLGAGTSNSNLKNDWDTVKVYSYSDNKFRNTGLLKCGVFIGDHSMLAISSKINTGTIIGVGAQVAISNFIPKFVADFSWLTDIKSESYIFAKFKSMMHRKAEVKKESLTVEDLEILEYIYTNTIQLRNY